MKRKILIVNDEMVVGGVARVLNNMLKYLDYDKYEVDLLVLHKHGDMLKDVPENINIISGSNFFEVCDLSLSEAIKAKNIRLIIKKIYFVLLMKFGLIENKIKKERAKFLTKHYDVEVAYKEGFCTIFVAAGDSDKKVNWVHVDYKVHNYSSNHMGLMKKALNNIDIHVAQSNDAAKSYKEVFELNDEFKIVYNLIDVEKIKEQASVPFSFETNDFNMVSVGRLHYQKAYLRMTEVIRRLKAAGYKFHFYVIGDGEERKEIEAKIREYHIEDCFILVGYTENPFKYVKNADLFVLQSLYESAPTVVYEALTVNSTPILSTAVAGVKEQLKNGYFGLICENSEDGLYNSLCDILNDREKIEIFKSRMKEYQNTNQQSLDKIDEIFN